MLHIGRNRAYKLVGDGSIRTIRLGTTHRIPKQCVIDYVMRSTTDKEKET
jgi:excisionase family DNA binding protein